MKVFCLGNPLVEKDALPLKLYPLLRKSFPEIEFIAADPSEDILDQEAELVIIDTVMGIRDVALFKNLSGFRAPRRFSLHNYDLSFHLRLLQKRGWLNKVMVIGIPPHFSLNQAQIRVAQLLRSISN